MQRPVHLRPHLERVFAQELAFLAEPVGTPAGGDYVSIGSAGGHGRR